MFRCTVQRNNVMATIMVANYFSVLTTKRNIIYCQTAVRNRQIIVTQTKYATVMLIVCWLLMCNPTLLAKNNRLVGLH